MAVASEHPAVISPKGGGYSATCKASGCFWSGTANTVVGIHQAIHRHNDRPEVRQDSLF